MAQQRLGAGQQGEESSPKKKKKKKPRGSLANKDNSLVEGGGKKANG